MSDKSANSMLIDYLKAHRIPLFLGAIVILLTYVTQEIFQARLEDKLRNIEAISSEDAIEARLDDLYPNLRDELSRGTDAKRRRSDQNATMEENFSGVGLNTIATPFYVLLDEECEHDQQCRSAECLRLKRDIARRNNRVENMITVVGEPDFDSNKEQFDKLYKSVFGDYSEESLAKAPKSVGDYCRDIEGLDVNFAFRKQSVDLYKEHVLKTTRLELNFATVLGGLFYVFGWWLTLFGRIHGLDTVGEA